jgi:prepilin-type processing-associated H-X9-DG protein
MEALAPGAALGLAAVLLSPILVTAGERSARAGCQTNLRALGAAIRMYIEDYDQTVPLARSVEIDLWPLVPGGRGRSPFVLTGGAALVGSRFGECPPLHRPGLWPLHLVLDSYVADPRVWHDPCDTGDLASHSPPRNTGPLAGRCPTAFATYGSSYQYNQSLLWAAPPAARRAGAVALSRGDLRPVRRDELRRAAEVPLLFDGEGFWHGTARGNDEPDPYLAAAAARSYNVLFADGHARSVPAPRLLNQAPQRPPGLLYQDVRR